jgi:hypothetical protein
MMQGYFTPARHRCREVLMPISIKCSCGKSEDVPDSFAGKHVRCKTCGARIKIGLPAVTSTVLPESAGSALNYSSPNRGNVVISRERMLAGRSCFCWGGIMLFMSFCVGFAVLASLGSPFARRGMTAASTGAALAINGAVLAILLALGITYIIGGENIRRGGMISVIVCLVLASIQLLFTGLATLLYFLVAVTQEPFMYIAVLISLLAAAALGQLDYYLIKIMRQPPVPA